MTIHNNPENLKPQSKFKHLKFVLADVETEDVTRFFNDSYTFIEAAKAAKEGQRYQKIQLLSAIPTGMQA